MLSSIIRVVIVTSFILISPSTVCSAKPKFVLVSSITCDRFSLDALYHEKYEVATEEVLTDSAVFVKSLLQNTEDSLQQIMIQLPGHDKSSKEEMMMHQVLKFLKDGFTKKINKIHDNITSRWNELITTNHAFLGAEENSSFHKVMEYMDGLKGAYEGARKTMDEQMEKVVSSVKIIVQNGLQALVQVAKSGGHTHDENETSSDKGDRTEEERLTDMVKDVVPSFLRIVTEKILDRKVNLSIPVTKTAKERDSVLDDLCFDVTLMRRKVSSIEPDLPEVPEYVDLARRNLYILWANTVNSVYQDKISDKSKSTRWKGNSTERFEKFWSNEDELADTLVSLLEVYP